MKKIFLLALIVFTISACNNQKENSMKQYNNNEPVMGLGQEVTDYFTGEAWLKYLSTEPETTDCLIYNVTFAPATRNYWHKHSQGQILLCTEGVGYYQERGQAAQHLTSGSVVHIPANVEHWHGAAPDSRFTHIGITPKATTNQVQWLEPVTDQDYNNATKEQSL